MSEGLDQDALEPDEPEFPIHRDAVEELFGEFFVLSPGIQIVLDGRPVSAPVLD